MEIKGIKKQGIPESTSFIDYSLPVSSGKAALNPSGTSSKKEYLALKAIENSLTNAAGVEQPVTTAISDDGGISITHAFPSDDGGITPTTAISDDGGITLTTAISDDGGITPTTAISDDGGITQAFPSDDGGITPTTAISDDGGITHAFPSDDGGCIIPGPVTTAISDDGGITPKPINKTTAINEDGGTPPPGQIRKRRKRRPLPPLQTTAK